MTDRAKERVMKSSTLKRLEQDVERQTGITADELRRTPICEMREKLERRGIKVRIMALLGINRTH